MGGEGGGREEGGQGGFLFLGEFEDWVLQEGVGRCRFFFFFFFFFFFSFFSFGSMVMEGLLVLGRRLLSSLDWPNGESFVHLVDVSTSCRGRCFHLRDYLRSQQPLQFWPSAQIPCR